MVLNTKAMVFSVAIFWGLAVFLAGLANLIWPGYAGAFLKLMSSIYPGYHASGSFRDLIVGTLYAILDGAISGFVFAWLYNYFVKKGRHRFKSV
jgi:hypothetical protein